MNRTRIINAIVSRRCFRAYLEISIEDPANNLAWIDCPIKVGVDPHAGAGSGKGVTRESDEFFAANRDKFDLVFIDGLHEVSQVERDVANALASLNPGGTIVLHDCFPPTAWHQRPVNEERGAAWCGGVWKAAFRHFSRSPFHCYVVDCDFGCGVIDTGKSRREGPVTCPENLDYNRDFAGFRSRYAVSPDAFERDLVGIQPFYHCAATGDWRDIVQEQLSQCAKAGVDREEIRCGLNGSGDDERWLLDVAAGCGLRLAVWRRSPNLLLHETPTIRLVESWARNEAPGDAKAFYFHTKGVSSPRDERKRRWRRYMARYVVEGWRQCVAALDDHDLVGVNWRDCRPIAHFSGNFWWARADWLRRLSGFEWYYSSPWYRENPGFNRYRLGCEFWISSCNKKPRVKSLGCRNVDFNFTRYLWTVEDP